MDKKIEIGVGIFVALSLAALFMLTMKVSNLGSFYENNGYIVNAYFDNIGGLKIKSPVTMSGVRIGRVVNIQLDDSRYEALVKIKIDSKFDKIPEDSSASIFTAGLLGEQYIGLDAGAEDIYLKENDTFLLTQSAVILEQLIGKFLLNSSEEKEEK
jgi:phospholipid/cholesterol/gamma-HCH transport system substrate-binding protein